jgi:cell division protein FtsB
MKNWIEILIKYWQKLNKYGVTIIVFATLTFFTGDGSILKRISYDRQIKSLENEIEYYTKKKEENMEKLNAIKSSGESLEKYAREQYLMTKPDEELFIIAD